MRIFISADIEGIAGVVSYAQTDPDGFEYGDARRWMTDEVVAAAEAAHDSGAEQVIVADSHGNGQNLLPDRMPGYVELVRSWPRPLGMMQGIGDGRFDAALLIGYHAGAMSEGGVLSHTLGGYLRQLEVNGQMLDETLLSAAIAGAFGVPITFISGDNLTVQQARARLGPIEHVITKRSYGRMSAQVRSPSLVCTEIRETVGRAIARAADSSPFRIEGPLRVGLTLRTALQAEVLAYLPFVSQSAAHEVTFEVADMIALAAMLEFLDQYDVRKF